MRSDLDRVPVLTSERILSPFLQAFLTLGKTLIPGLGQWKGYQVVDFLDTTNFPTAMVVVARDRGKM